VNRATPVIVFLLFQYVIPSFCAAAGRPAAGVEPGVPRRSIVSLSYSQEYLRPELSALSSSRGVLDGRAGYDILDGLGVWARARVAGPWSEGGNSWTLTDIDFGPRAGARGLKGRFDLDGWLTFAAPAGNEPASDVWHDGVKDWSYGVGGRISAIVLGAGKSSHVTLGFDMRYRSKARSGWVYLPHHSVAIADPEGAAGGSVVTWQGRIEMRNDRARLATVLLREAPVDAEALLSGEEKPLFLMMCAGVSVGKGIGVLAKGELLISGDDDTTQYDPRSILPEWGFSVGLSWEN
jgi:hypothetical protein